MDPEILEVNKTYRTTTPIKACFYDSNDCLMPDMVDLPAGTELVFIGFDDDDDDGYIFTGAAGTKYCLHDDDMASIAEA